MNRTKLVLAISGICLCAAASAQQQSSVAQTETDQESYAIYRRVVLGDTSVQLHKTAMRQVAVKVVPNGYARYLVLNGTSEAEALRQAGQIKVDALAAYCETSLLDSYERYQLTVQGRSREEILRSRVLTRPTT